MLSNARRQRGFVKLTDSPGKRLAAVRAELGLSQRALAQEIDVSGGLVGQLEADIAPPSRSFLQKISNRYMISADWLLNGTGEMRQRPTDRSMTGQRMEDFAQVRYWPRGGDAPLEHWGEVAFLNSWLRERTHSPGECYLLRVPDDRMTPIIPAGALVLFDHSQKAPQDDALFALRLDDGTHIRRLRQIGRQWLVECDNRAYPDRLTLSKKEDLARIKGQVLWQSSLLEKSK